MKRISRHIIILMSAMALVSGFPSCRSHKSQDKDSHRERRELLRKGHRHKGGSRDSGRLSMNTRKKIVEEALSWKGTPYRYSWAKKGVATDCSGLVLTVYEKVAGVKLPRNSARQRDFCKRIKKKDVLKGDLVFFATGKDPDKVSHVGIMIDDRNFVHASASKGVVVSDVTQSYYVRTFKGYGRVPD